MGKIKYIYGVGINDADYVVNKRQTKNGKSSIIWTCPYYCVWRHMLMRCYSSSCHLTQPTYIGCSVDPEWHYFMPFKEWMENKDWQGKQLDKDIIIIGNKKYSPLACAFVDGATNKFLCDRAAARGDFPIGVNFNKKRKKFYSRCRNPFTRKQEFLGSFECAEDAHSSWLNRKNELANKLALIQSDERVSAALKSRYSAGMGIKQ